ncbi:hypothetical protein KC946_04040, partial [Candidatus Saccharibacteria bacterium]|nr:hypothetical protein [Candidatus Saccharibacteria bacterium]
MTSTQIQNFLNVKVAVCDTNGTKAYGGTTRAAHGTSRGYPPPYTCLKDFRQNTPSRNLESGLCNSISAKNNRSAAQIIDDIARSCGVSQKALIVMLQKEQSLITDDWPWSIQYRSAMGYGCPDTAPCDSEYYGFFNQVYNAARQFKRYKANPTSWNHIPGANNSILYQANNPGCGTKNVYVENYATAGLYNYTPYTPNQAALNNLYGYGDGCSAYGNRNFWRLFNDWFGTVSTNSLPGGARLERESSTGRIYLITNGKKYLIPSWEYMKAYKFDRINVISVTTNDLNSYYDEGPLTNLIRDPLTGRIDMVNSGERYWAYSSAVCSNWNLDCFNTSAVNTLPTDLYARLIDKGQLKPLARNSSGTVYKMGSGNKSPIYSPDTLKDLGYTWNNVLTVQPFNLNQGLGSLLITRQAVLKFSPNPTIYFYDGSNYHVIPSMHILKAWNLSSKVKRPATSSLNQDPPPTGEPLGNRVQIGSNKYLVDSGKRYLLTVPQTNLWPTDYQTFSSSLASELPSHSLKKFLRVGIRMYMLDDDKLRYAPSNYVLKKSGYRGSHSLLQQETIQSVPLSDDLLANGSLIRNIDNGNVYVVSLGKLHYISGPTLFNNYRFNWSTIKSYDLSRIPSYPIGPTLTNKSRLSNGYSIFSDREYFISSSLALSMGIKQNEFQNVDNNLASFSQRVNVTRFIRNRNTGAIYYGSGGALRYVTSINSFKKYGGNTTNLTS